MALYPGLKVIVGEITPRMDEMDIHVKATNTLLNQFANGMENVFLIKNDNLRPSDFFEEGDAKHLRRSCIARFAANIKIALRKAYGIKFDRSARTYERQQYYNNYNNHQHHSQPQIWNQHRSFEAHSQTRDRDLGGRQAENENERMSVFKHDLLRSIASSISSSISEAFQRVGT